MYTYKQFGLVALIYDRAGQAVCTANYINEYWSAEFYPEINETRRERHMLQHCQATLDTLVFEMSVRPHGGWLAPSGITDQDLVRLT